MEDRPSANPSSPGSLPIDLAIPALTIMREKSGLFSIQPAGNLSAVNRFPYEPLRRIWYLNVENKYRGDPKSGLVQILNGLKMVGCGMVWCQPFKNRAFYSGFGMVLLAETIL